MEQIKIKIIDTKENHLLIEKFTQKSSPVLTWNGSDDNFQPIMASEFNFNILNENASDGKFFDLFSGDESRFRIEIVDENERIFWSGFLLPDQYSEPYKNGALFVAFTATDGLGLLKDKPFNMFDFDTEESVITIIANCLKKTNLYQNLYVSTGLSMNNFDWKNVYLLINNFRGQTNMQGSFYMQDETEYDSCYDVLEKLLKAIGCTLFSYENKWYLIGWNKKHLSNDTFKVYNFHGDFLNDELVVKKMVNGFFADDLLVYTNSPLQTVNVTCDLEQEDEIVGEKHYYKETGQGGFNPVPLPEEQSENPLQYWRAQTGLQVGLGNAKGQVTVEQSGGNSLAYDTAPWCIKLRLNESTAVNGSKYISLKSDIKFLEQKVLTTGKLIIELEMFAAGENIDALTWTEGKFLNAFRIDIMVGNELILTTRNEVLIPRTSPLKYELSARSESDENVVGPNYNSSYRLVNKVKVSATLKEEIIISNDGELQVRIYQPKFIQGQEVDFREIHIPKLDIIFETDSERKSYNQRLIKFSKKEIIDLDFYASKSNLTIKNFRLPRTSIRYFINSFSNVPLSNKIETDDWISYSLSSADADWIIRNQTTCKIKKGDQNYFLNDVFGRQQFLTGFYIDSDGFNARIFFNKEIIRDLFYLWSPFDGFEIFVHKSEPISISNFDLNRDDWIKWKRFGSNIITNYGTAYGRMMLDCKSSSYCRLEGIQKQIISPIDLIRFKWIEERLFWPSNLSVNFSDGNSTLMLVQTKFENVNDGNIIN